MEPVQTAMCWQEPDDDDYALSAREVRDALLSVAQAVTIAPEARWWTSPIAAKSQQYVEWLGEHGGPPARTFSLGSAAVTPARDSDLASSAVPSDPG